MGFGLFCLPFGLQFVAGAVNVFLAVLGTFHLVTFKLFRLFHQWPLGVGQAEIAAVAAHEVHVVNVLVKVTNSFSICPIASRNI